MTLLKANYQDNLEKEKEEDAKLYDVLKYTQETFRELGFNDMEILQICESVRYFVINREPLTNTSLSSIKKNLRTVAGKHKIEIDENICR